MNWTRSGRHIFGLATAVVASLILPHQAPATFSGRMMTMSELVNSSDEIVVGVVEKTESVWRNGKVETDTTVIVQEGLKGKKYSLGPGLRAKDLKSAPRLTLTTFGGSPKNSPIGQYVAYSPKFVESEEVVLFLKYPESNPQKRDRMLAAAPKSKVPTSPKIVGFFQGKFTVYLDEATNQKKVTRLVLDSFGIVPSDKSARAALRALASNRLGVTSGPIVARRTEDAPAMGNLLKPALPKSSSKTTAKSRSEEQDFASLNVPVMPLSDFLTQIKESAQ